ncbi:tannase and feruloyl esterase [Corynespora cassiicola Philippines]|uniref:Carboxylic ester hydrolase n=1 Tax=Corynespora cassiicola Philippines TaxID=1448308 RepID=A0A2T2P6E0_CORCC|nr:tannase and feruloyl esterase [Corynespora cassiicola Philippines]
MVFALLYTCILSLILAVTASEDTSAQLVCSDSSFRLSNVPGATVLSITTEEKKNVNTSALPPLIPGANDVSFCGVKVYVTHPGTNDKVLIETWLPLTQEAWNGRFQGVGGGGFATGLFEFGLGPAVQAGYAASSTDGGHPVDFIDATWLLNEDKSINYGLLNNFIAKSVADMILVGKILAEQFYGKKPHHSYFSGCSQGGRQGYALAQRYPGLVDGILASAPALKFPGVVMAALWPHVAMRESGVLVSNCEFEWFDKKVMEACDILDGVIDGVIGDPDACDFDLLALVGESLECSGHAIEVTLPMAEMVQKVRSGPKTPFGTVIWPGLAYGTSMKSLVNVSIDATGMRIMQPQTFLDNWVKVSLLKDLSFNTSALTYTEYLALWAQTEEEYSWIANCDSPDLSGFYEKGGKLLSWHGTSDSSIPYQTTTAYYDRVKTLTGGVVAVDEFYRLFLAPGVEHCGLGAGAAPANALEQLVKWVEESEGPETLEADKIEEKGQIVKKNLCRYPKRLKYLGLGDAKQASNWGCEEIDGYEDTNNEGYLGSFKDKLKHATFGMGF